MFKIAILALVVGLGVCMAVGSHRFIEHNRPLIRVNAFYGALSDLRMMGLGLTGSRRLASEFDIQSAPGQGTRVTIVRWK